MLSVLLYFVTISGGVPQKQKSLDKPGHTQAKKSASYRYSGFEPLTKASGRQEIISYYKKRSIGGVEAQRFQRNGKDLLCLTVNSGSGISLVATFAYLLHNAEWRLIYQRPPSRHTIIQFVSVDGTQIQVKGGFPSQPKGEPFRVEYKVLHTIDLTKTASQLLY